MLGELLGRATEQETDFVKRLLTGGLRQGALAGSDGRRNREGGRVSPASSPAAH